MYFEYDEKEMNYLISKDEKLASVIKEVGHIKRKINSDFFENLIFKIIGQQISNKAYLTICQRFKDLLGEINPDNILSTSDETLQHCGISFRKVEYIKNASFFWKNEDFDFKNIQNYSDEEIIQCLTKIKGVGIWTVEMLLIFSLGRKNVISYNDLVIKKGLMNLYGLEKIDKKIFNKYKALYSPYATVASFYLWNIGNLDT